jgi:DNA-binding LytR/AlgR family response regulator
MFIVNIQFVEKLSGNSQGFRLRLKNVEPTIPVSRSLDDEITKRFSHLKN